MKQLSLRKIPVSVEGKLRELAVQNRESINKTAIKVLEKGLGISSNTEVKRDLSVLVGRWSEEDEEEFEQNVAIFETIDEEVWR